MDGRYMPLDLNKLMGQDNIKVCLTYPSTILGFILNGKLGAYYNLLRCILDELSKTDIDLIESSLSSSNKDKFLVMPPKLSILNNSSSIQNKVLLYYLVRLFQPTNVIETGVWDGQTSWFILRGLEDNGKGQLTSIDLGLKQWIVQTNDGIPAKLTLPTKEIGDFVPINLRDRWHLIIGDSKTKLPEVLDDLAEIDFFYHDDEWSYEGMTSELFTTLAHMKKGGIIASDLVLSNNAFLEISMHFYSYNIIGDRFGYGIKKD